MKPLSATLLVIAPVVAMIFLLDLTLSARTALWTLYLLPLLFTLRLASARTTVWVAAISTALIVVAGLGVQVSTESRSVLFERTVGLVVLWYAVAVVLEHKKAARKQAERRMAAVHRITRILAEATSLEAASSAIIQAICEGTGWIAGSIWRVDDQTGALSCLDTWHVPGADVAAFVAVSRSTPLLADIGLPGRVWACGQPTWITDIVRDPNFLRAQAAALAGIRSAFAFPIMKGQTVIGILEFFDRRSRKPDDDLMQVIGGLGTLVGQFIERKGVEAERAQLIGRLQQALDSVKTLRGLLPICASCKKVRNDQGYWNQIEVYLREHTEAEFTHSYCPECLKKHHPELQALMAGRYPDLFRQEQDTGKAPEHPSAANGRKGGPDDTQGKGAEPKRLTGTAHVSGIKDAPARG